MKKLKKDLCTAVHLVYCIQLIFYLILENNITPLEAEGKNESMYIFIYNRVINNNNKATIQYQDEKKK